jgi:hypothetical protein
MREAFVATFAAVSSPSYTTFSMLVSRPKAKRELSKLTLTQEASLKDLEGGARNSAAADFAEALRR